jgi:amino acid transporter
MLILGRARSSATLTNSAPIRRTTCTTPLRKWRGGGRSQLPFNGCQEKVEPAYRAADRLASRFQKQRQTITISAAIVGTVAVLLATFDALDFSRFIVPTLYFSVAAVIAFVAVLLGIVKLRQVKWMFLRHKAERFRFLKFRFLIDPHLWGDDAAHGNALCNG